MNVFSDLAWRGLIHDASDGVEQHLGETGVTAYIGFDPTARSLHVGSLLQLIALERLRRAGHHPMALVGGGTGMVGDPSGKSKERNLLSAGELQANVEGVRNQIETFLGPEVKVVDNGEWLSRLNLVEFLRDIGKHFSVNVMLARESVKRRIASEQGISYTEFSYMILQAYDFMILNERFGCSLQVGGSDQWGNIVSGIDLVRIKTGRRAHGLTLPLITTSAGTKFGKTEEGTVWLDPELTSPYRFFQFWLNTGDNDVVPYLKSFTFLDQAEIEDLDARHAAAPQDREGQKRLAREVTIMVHGQAEFERAQRATAVFFGAELSEMSVGDVMDVFEDVPSSTQPKARFAAKGLPLVDLLVDAGLASSKKDARRSIESGGAYVNNRRVSAADACVSLEDAIEGRVLVLRKGKKSYHVVQIEG